MRKKKTALLGVLLFLCVFTIGALKALESQDSTDQDAMHETDDIALNQHYKNVALFLKALVEGAHEEDGNQEELMPVLVNCYKQLHEKQSVAKEDLQEALPSLLECIEAYCQHMGVEFPRTIPALSGHGHGCSLARVLALLDQLLAEVTLCCSTVGSNVNEILVVLEREFNGTFSAIEEVIYDMQGTFSVIFDIQNTLTACCENSSNNFNGTFSALDAGFDATFTLLQEIIETMTLSINGTFSAIQDVNDTLTACCQSMQNNFQETWTLLATLNPTSSLIINFFEGFQETWTMLAAEFNGTFSALDECCDTINNEFQQTWTLLAAGFNDTFSIMNNLPDFDCKETFSTIAALQNSVVTDFNGTWSILQAGFDSTFSSLLSIVDPLEVSIDGFQGTFSALDACCENINDDFQQTWTLLDAGFNDTFSSLADLQARLLIITTTLEASLTPVFTALNADFAGTFSSIAHVKNIVADSFNDIFTELSDMSLCFAMSLTAEGTITTPGYYCLENDINGSFTIAANDVVLDLNSHVVSNGGIFVLTGTYRTIKNGRLDNSNAGIVLTGNSNTIIQDLAITNATLTPAITFTGIHFDNVVKGVIIENCRTGLASTNDNNLRIQDLTIQDATSSGMTFTNSTNLHMHTVSILNGRADGINLTNNVNTIISDAVLYKVSNFGLITFGQTHHNNFTDMKISMAIAINGIRLNNPINCLLKECIVSGLGSTLNASFQGINLNEGYYNTLESCIVRDILSSNAITGFLFTCSNTIISNCVAEGYFTTSGDAIGFSSSQPHDVYFNCYVHDVETTALASSRGYTVQGPFDVPYTTDFFNCSAANIRLPNSSVTAGFYCAADSTHCYNCTAVRVRGTTAAHGGFMAELGRSRCVFKNCVTTHNQSSGFGKGSGDIATDGTIFYTCQACDNTGNGFFWGAGGVIPNINILEGCTATDNGVNGFVSSDNTNPVYHCFATTNGTNYSGAIPNQQAASASPTLAGSNVRF